MHDVALVIQIKKNKKKRTVFNLSHLGALLHALSTLHSHLLSGNRFFPLDPSIVTLQSVLA
jgi:hypothetical protein